MALCAWSSVAKTEIRIKKFDKLPQRNLTVAIEIVTESKM